MSRPASGGAPPSARRAPRRRLSDAVALRLVHHDETAFGSMVSGRCEQVLQSRLVGLHAFRARHGLARLIREGAAILDRVLPRALVDLAEGPGRLAEHWLYPEPTQVTPALLAVARDLDTVVARLPVGARELGDLAAWIGECKR